jgi:CRP/FNR family transcriptional regulator, dissimilatory nitrate respiration regulator
MSSTRVPPGGLHSLGRGVIPVAMTSRSEELSQCPLFGRLAPAELEHLASASRTLEAPAGQFIFREGQPCEGFYVVLAGVVRVFKLGPDGRERTLHVIRPPHTFAEAAMFGPGTYPAFAQAVEPARLVLVQREPFLRLLGEQPATALRMFESLSKWLHQLLEQLENETFLNARAKLAHYLLREARAQSPQPGPRRIELNQPKKDVALQLGMAPETFSRAQADLDARGLVRIAGRKIEILDPGGLEQLLLGEIEEG